MPFKMPESFDSWRCQSPPRLDDGPDDEPNDQDATPLEKPDDEVRPDHELGGEG